MKNILLLILVVLAMSALAAPTCPTNHVAGIGKSNSLCKKCFTAFVPFKARTMNVN